MKQTSRYIIENRNTAFKSHINTHVYPLETPCIYGGSFAAIFGQVWQNFLALNLIVTRYMRRRQKKSVWKI